MRVMRVVGDKRNEGTRLGNLGNAYYSLSDARRAIEIYEQQLAIHREIGDRRGEGAALFNMSRALDKLRPRTGHLPTRRQHSKSTGRSKTPTLMQCASNWPRGAGKSSQ